MRRRVEEANNKGPLWSCDASCHGTQRRVFAQTPIGQPLDGRRRPSLTDRSMTTVPNLPNRRGKPLRKASKAQGIKPKLWRRQGSSKRRQETDPETDPRPTRENETEEENATSYYGKNPTPAKTPKVKFTERTSIHSMLYPP